jgi:hypothetical protein
MSWQQTISYFPNRERGNPLWQQRWQRNHNVIPALAKHARQRYRRESTLAAEVATDGQPMVNRWVAGVLSGR